MTGFYCPLNTPPYINIREQRTLQTLHKILHFLRISLILRTLHCVGFEAKILHKPYTNPAWELRVKESKSQREGAYPNPSLKGRALLRR